MISLSNTKTFSYKFSDLSISENEVCVELGTENNLSTDYLIHYVGKILGFASEIKNINGSYVLFDNIHFDLENYFTCLNDIEFHTQKVVTMQLRKATSAALFICTAGHELETYSRVQMKQGNMLEGYIADVLGSIVVEKAMDLIHNSLAKSMQLMGLGVSDRYSPGYCGWNVIEQKKLFGLLPPKLSGVNLLPSSLMKPMKSVSGIIGIGSGLKQFHYTCKICDFEDCYKKNKIAITNEFI